MQVRKGDIISMRQTSSQRHSPSDLANSSHIHGNCNGVRGAFRMCAQCISNAAGSVWAFAIAVAVIVGWGVTGPIFHFSDTWQLVINTATTIVTFLMVFLIQNTQNRDTRAIQLKLDELLRGVKGARTGLVRLEELTDQELKELETSFEALRQ